ERAAVLRIRLRLERIARLRPLHLVHRRAERGRPGDERRAVEGAARTAGREAPTGRQARGEQLAGSGERGLAVLAEAGDTVVGRCADVLGQLEVLVAQGTAGARHGLAGTMA